MSRRGIPGSWGSLIFEEPSSCFPYWVHQFTFPPTVFKYFFFSTSLPAFIYFLLDDCYFGRCEGVTSVGVDLHFFEDYRCKASFSVPVCRLYFFFGKNVYWDLCPFLNEVGFFLLLFSIQLYEFFMYFRYNPLTKHMNCKYFLLFHFISLCFILFTSAIIPVVTIFLSFVFRIRSKKSFRRQLLKRFLPIFSSYVVSELLLKAVCILSSVLCIL